MKRRFSLNCSNCGKEVKTEDATFCPYCAKSLYLKSNPSEMRKSFPKIAGILTIMGSALIITIDVTYFTISSRFFEVVFSNWSLLSGFTGLIFSYYLIAEIIGVLSFVFGLVGGVFAIKRRHIKLSVFGMSFLCVSGIMFFFGTNQMSLSTMFQVSGVSISRATLWTLEFSPIFTLAIAIPFLEILSLILLTLSKSK